MEIELSPPPELEKTTTNTLNAIGQKIREARQSQDMTLQTLADACGLSPSMLSLVERGRASPSIGTLIVVAHALNITMSDLMTAAHQLEENLVTRAAHKSGGDAHDPSGHRVLREDPARGVSVTLKNYEPNASSSKQPISHEGFQYGYVLEGELSVEIGGVRYEVGPGDLIAYSSRRMHRVWNHGDQNARAIWFDLDRD